MQTLRHILSTALIVFVALSLLLFFFQRKMIYYPDRSPPNSVLAQSLGFESIQLETEDRLRLLAWYKKAQPNYPTIIMFHGNAGHIGYRLPLARQWADAGLGILMVEYRGYGGNPGSPTEKGLYKDGKAALSFLAQQNVPPQDIVLFGASLGTGVAMELASQHNFCSLILQTPFLSLTAVARYHYPWILIPPADRYDSLSKIKTVNTPLLVLHGKRDNIVPFSQGKALFEASPAENKKFAQFPDGNHNNLWCETFYQATLQFILQNCRK